jgi:hypothetical protein
MEQNSPNYSTLNREIEIKGYPKTKKEAEARIQNLKKRTGEMYKASTITELEKNQILTYLDTITWKQH